MMSKRTKRSNLPVKCSPAAETVGSNVDLLTEILLRVPTKPLIKFKCVSKYWLSLISNSEFGSNHTRRNPSPPVSGMYVFDRWWIVRNSHEDMYSTLTLGGRRGNSVPALSFLHKAMSGIDGATTCCSSNGLILCCGGYIKHYYLIVCNPTIQKFTTIPRCDVTFSQLGCFGEEAFLCFDPTKSPYYKIVVVRSGYARNVSKLAIYSSECASWKIVRHEARDPDFGRGAIWNGGIIWVGSSFVSRLDLNTEKLTMNPLAQGQNGLTGVVDYFGECRGHLLLIQLTTSHDAMEVKELKMDKDEFRWIERNRVDLTSFILPNRSRCLIYVISVVKGAKENDLAVVFLNRGKVFSCNLGCRTMKMLCESCPRQISRLARKREIYQFSHKFIESLSPV